MYKGKKAISSYVYATREGYSHSPWKRWFSKMVPYLFVAQGELLKKYDLEEPKVQFL